MKYPLCKLTSIISPGKYCVVSTDKEHVSEIQDLENNMRKEMCCEETSDIHLSCQMCVAWMDSEGKFRRGIIEKKLDEETYQVLLMDYGKIIQAKKSNIKVITNKNFVSVEPLSFIVKLYGLVPAKFACMGEVRKPRACKYWVPDSQVFVQNLFESNHSVVVQSILIQQRTVYGDLFLKLEPDLKFSSLRKLLCKNEFCVFSESFFVKQERLDLLNQSFEVENKMEFVEKWQRENFGEFQRNMLYQTSIRRPYQKCSYGSPVSFLSSRADKVDKPPPESSPLDSVSETFRQTNQTSGTKEGPPEASVIQEVPKRFGSGRGKLRKMVEMKKEASLNAAEGNPFQSVDSACTFETISKVSLGRGKFLKKYLEIKKSLDFNTSSSGERNSGQCISDRPPDVEKLSDQKNKLFESAFKMERAILKPGEFSELGSNELTEVSLSVEDGPPPLVRNLKKEKTFENPVLNKAEYVCQNALSKYNFEINSVAESSKLEDEIFDSRVTEKEKSSFLNEPKPHFESSELEVLSLYCEKKDEVYNQLSNLLKSHDFWTPYVRFVDSAVEPVSTFRELPIQPNIIKNLEKGGTFEDLSQVQRWAIPAIRKQHNTIIIGSTKTGKTLSYIISLMDYIQDEFYFEELPQGNGPLVVIVASSSNVCESIYYMCHSLLGNFTKCEILKPKTKIVVAHGNGCEKEVWVNLTNGCDILISTPHCLTRLLEVPILTNFGRLTCLVLDEIDVITQNPFWKKLRIIIEKAQLSTKNRHHQKIIVGEKWTPRVESLVKKYVKSYALVTCSYSEAVIYEGLKPIIYLVEKNKKAKLLVDKLKDKTNKSKIVVVCEEASEATQLSDFLNKKGIPTLLAHENVMADRHKELRAIWKSSADSLLIITDGVLNEMNIREAQTLVHYSLPSKSKTNFYLRYSTLKNFLRYNDSFTKSQLKIQSSKLHNIILVDDENHYQLPHIVDFVTRLGVKVSQKIHQKCQEIRRQIEIGKCNFPICRNLLAFGRCRNLNDCPQRHAFVKALDCHGNLPNRGWVNFVVLKTHDASWISARLTEYVDDKGETSKLDMHSSELSFRLSDFYKAEENHKFLGMPKIRDVCAVMAEIENQKVFYRAKIIEYLKVDKYEKPLEVSVKLIDQGDVWKRKSTELYELPEELSKYPPTAVDVWIVGVQPMDFDVSWSQKANDFTKEMMTQKLTKNQYWSGKIALALNNTLFLDPIKRKEYLPQLNIHVFDLVVQSELFNNKIAIANNQHLPPLLTLCAQGDIEVAKKEEKKHQDVAVIQPQWAFFDLNFVRVKFLAAESTSTVFLQPKKFEKVLQELEEDCQKQGAKTTMEMKNRKTNRSDSAAHTLRVGMFCLALFEDGKWNRGRIESENENQFYVYFVDHGDFLFVPKSNVVPISQSLLLRLPCQAIECRLVGMQREKECPLEILQEIYSFSRDGEEHLYAYIVSKDLQPSITRGRKYSLNLYNKKGISLNKMLVDRATVRLEESEKKYLENINIELSDEEENLDEEEEKDLLEEKEDEEQIKKKKGQLIEEKNSFDLKHSVDNSWENYFNNLTDEVFEDEYALEFLKEFAFKIFPSCGPFQEKGLVAKETVEEGKKKKEKHSTFSEDAEKTKQERDATAQNFQRLLKFYKKRQSRNKQQLQLKSREKVLTPQVLWCQNQVEVQIKILLGNVMDYSLECTVNNISFRCVLGEKFYAMDLRLYGAVSPQLTKVTIKAFHVLVVLTKLAFPLWPRLHVDEGKHRWISLDVESLADKEDIFSDKIRSAIVGIESGVIKEGIRNDKISPCSDSEDSAQLEVNADDSNDSN